MKTLKMAHIKKQTNKKSLRKKSKPLHNTGDCERWRKHSIFNVSEVKKKK